MASHIGSVVDRIDLEVPIADSSREVVAPGEADIDLVGDREVAVADQQGGSNLLLAVGLLCLHRTWKSLEFSLI